MLLFKWVQVECSTSEEILLWRKICRSDTWRRIHYLSGRENITEAFQFDRIGVHRVSYGDEISAKILSCSFSLLYHSRNSTGSSHCWACLRVIRVIKQIPSLERSLHQSKYVLCWHLERSFFFICPSMRRNRHWNSRAQLFSRAPFRLIENLLNGLINHRSVSARVLEEIKDRTKVSRLLEFLSNEQRTIKIEFSIDVLSTQNKWVD